MGKVGTKHCPQCGAFLNKNGSCSNTVKHAALGRGGLRRPVGIPDAARTAGAEGLGVISVSDVDSAFEELMKTARVMSADEINPNAFQLPVQVSEPIPGATGGFLAGIPERLEIGGKEFNPNMSLWHHIVRREDGTFDVSEERKNLYYAISAKNFDNKTSVDDPVFIMLGGGPASGKTTLKETGIVPFYEMGVDEKGEPELKQGNVVDINADDIKVALPEYQEMLASDNELTKKAAAGFTHNESSVVSSVFLGLSTKSGCNTILDGTGTWGHEKMEREIGKYRGLGYRVEAIYCDTPVDEAVERADLRGKKTGRVVDEGVIRSTHAKVPGAFANILRYGHFDKVQLWDTSNAMNGNPQIILDKERGKKPRKLNKSKLSTFLNRGKVKESTSKS